MEYKIIFDYTGIPFDKILELDYVDFLFLKRDAFIYLKSKTEEGRDYLEKCWLLEQTKPDRQTLRKFFGKE